MTWDPSESRLKTIESAEKEAADVSNIERLISISSDLTATAEAMLSETEIEREEEQLSTDSVE